MIIRKLYTICFLLIFLSTTFVRLNAQVDPAVARLVNDGVRLHKNKDYIGALKAFEEALTLEPSNTLLREISQKRSRI